MIMICEKKDPLRGKSRTLTVYHVALALIVGVATGAMPIGLDLDQEQLLLSSKAAFAKDKGDKDGGGRDNGNSGGGMGGGDGGGRDNGNSGGGNGGGTSKGGADKATSSDTGATAEPGVTGATPIPPLAIATPEVLRAQFTTKIKKGDPVNAVNVVNNPHMAVSFFTEVRGMAGRTVIHRWVRGGVVEYQASFKINGAKWKFWSTMLLPTDKPGTWRVEIVTDDNKVIRSDSLYYRPVG